MRAETQQQGVGSGDTGGSQVRIMLGKVLQPSGDLTVTMLYSITFLLVGFGLIMVLSSSSITSYLAEQGFFGRFWRQFTFAVLGIPIMFLLSRLPLRFLQRWAWGFLGLGLLLQALVFTPLGINNFGNRNWIQLGGVTAQPSEFLKLALVVWIATVLAKKESLLHDWRHELIPVVFPGAVLALGMVMLGRDLGTTIMMGAMVFGALYFGGVSMKSIGIVAGVALLGLVLAVVTSPNRINRLLSHAGGNADYSGTGWQPLHGLWALAGGGIFGSGLGNSKAKWSWLPAADNDYIFAIVGEELGLIGAVLLIALFVVLAVLMLRVIAETKDRFGRALVGGILVWVVGQAFANIGVVIGLLPVFGVPLPLISAGGTALIANLAAMGVVIAVAKDNIKRRESFAVGQPARGMR